MRTNSVKWLLMVALSGALAACNSEPSCSDGTRNGDETGVDCGGSCAACLTCGSATDCTSGVCVGGSCRAATCSDGVKNGDESDIDCGGSCAACPECSAATDCASGVCVDGSCRTATCSDGVKNGDESAIDCGGSCAACPAGSTCAAPSDCGSLVCTDGRCDEATCSDGVKNGGERDIDCAGVCAPCGTDATCMEAADCLSGVCTDGRCAAPACGDSVKNGGESDIDCGGACAPCADDAACAAPGDCVSGVCAAGVCRSATCGDGAKNGDESDTDCGGSCAPCASNAACTAPADCASGICTDARCAAPACDDGVKNGDESDTDCGGTCDGCGAEAACVSPGDCASGVCTGNVCLVATCHDTVRNGDETDVDCGGACGRCADTATCAVPADCVSGVCTGQVCVAPSCSDTVRNGDESDLDCGGSCLPCVDDAGCGAPGDCASGVCTAGLCIAPACDDGVKNGTESDLDCGGACGACVVGSVCGSGADCVSTVCEASVCHANLLSISGGGQFACALLYGGRIKCWGQNTDGQLGLGDTSTRGSNPSQMGPALPAVDLGTGRTARAVSAGISHACAILDDGSVKCWGANANGQLGLGDSAPRGKTANTMGDALPTVALGSGRTAVQISAGNGHTCAILDDGSVKCWGANGAGQLGLGDRVARGDGPNEMGDALLPVPLGRTAVSLALSTDGSCALLDDGTAKCWGNNSSGVAGQESPIASIGGAPDDLANLQPIALGTGRTVLQLAAGYVHVCALLDDFSVKCWGYNTDGRLGVGDTASHGDTVGSMGDGLPAVALGTGRTARQLTAHANGACAVLDDGSVKCWGLNNAGQLGVGDTTPRGATPASMGDGLPVTRLATGRTVVQLEAAWFSVCARLDDDSLQCWGDNGYQQLGTPGGQAFNARGDQPGEMGDALPRTKLW